MKKELLQDIKNTVQLFDEKSELTLYGSRANGAFNDDSDWDILVLTEKPVDFGLKSKIRQAVYKLQDRYNVILSVLVFNKKDWVEKHFVTGLFKEVTLEGVAI